MVRQQRVIFQQMHRDRIERCAHRRQLRDDVDAVAIVLHHARDPAHLTFDAVQSFQHRRFMRLDDAFGRRWFTARQSPHPRLRA